jgi:PIN domain nuclease of toxin-antitoxin system
MIVLDTSALLFWTGAPDRLSAVAKQRIENTEHILISSISIWEIGLKTAKGKLALPITLREYVERLLRSDKIEIMSVDLQTWLANLELDWDHRDPADRTIVATAQLLGCELITSDKKILDFYPLAVW